MTALIPPQPEEWALVWLATGLTLVIALVGLLTPWSRLPRWTWLVPPLAYFVVVALLRQANDGSVSGYAPLALFPVIWIHGESATDLVSRADVALYAAKRAGRDALVHAWEAQRIRIVLVPCAQRRPCASSIRASVVATRRPGWTTDPVQRTTPLSTVSALVKFDLNSRVVQPTGSSRLAK